MDSRGTRNTVLELVENLLIKETVGMISVAQGQALQTRNYKINTLKEQSSKRCWICDKRDDTVMYILSECEKLSQGEYKKRHDCVTLIIHWGLCGIHGHQRSKNWFDHRTEPVLETSDVKILLDYNIHIHRVIETKRPDNVVLDRMNFETQIVDVTFLVI